MKDVKKEIKELQKIDLEILNDIDRVCKENNITYFMGEGSLLGTVRHQGFIPWDDDLDLLMLREDYDKFLSVAPNIMKDKYEIQHAKTIDNYWSPFMKVRLLNSSKFKQKHITHLTKNNGVCVDIFPLDYVPKRNGFGQFLQANKIKFFRRMLSLKLGLYKVSNYKDFIIKTLSYFFTVSNIHKILDNNFKKYNHKPHNYIVNLGSYYNYKKQIFPKDYYEKKEVFFENIKVNIPKKSHEILSSIYGDYMKMPKEEDRDYSHHHYL